jgi:hypothetical protein
MLTLSPGARFIIGIVITAAIGISAGTVHLTDAIPGAWIPAVVAWSGIIAFIGSAIQTGLQGLGMSNANKVAAAQSLPADDKVALAADSGKVQQVITTTEIANSPRFAQNQKVVSNQ